MESGETYFVNATRILDEANLNGTSLLSLLEHCNEILIQKSDGLFIVTHQEKFHEVFTPTWLQVYHFFFDVILVGSIILAGVTGNVLSCLVLIKDRSHGTTSLLLTSLAVCDTMFLVDCLFFQCLKTLSFYILWMGYIYLYAHISKILYGAGMTVRMLRNWTVVLISLERWVAVCKPLHAPSICTRKKARLAIMLLTLACILYCLPNFFIVDAKGLYCHGQQNLSQHLVHQSVYPSGIVVYQSAIKQWVKDNYLFRLIYRLIGYTVLIVFLPTMIIAIFNVLLVRGIKYANARRAQIMARIDCATRHCDSYNHHQPCVPAQESYCRPENHAYFVRVEKSTRSRTGEVNRLCVGVIIIYLVCELPAVAYQLIHLLQHRGAIDITKPVTNALVCLNSGVNFFVYVLLGRRFRSQLKDMLYRLFCRCQDNSDHGHIVHSDLVHSSYGRMSTLGAAKDENDLSTFDEDGKTPTGCKRMFCRNKGKQRTSNGKPHDHPYYHPHHTQTTSVEI